MEKIYKYPLALEDKQTIEMPIGSQILCVQTQFNQPYIWAMVNPNLPPIGVKIEIYGTGESITNPFPSYLKYIGTFQINNGHEVYHVFLNELVSVPINPKKSKS